MMPSVIPRIPSFTQMAPNKTQIQLVPWSREYVDGDGQFPEIKGIMKGENNMVNQALD